MEQRLNVTLMEKYFIQNNPLVMGYTIDIELFGQSVLIKVDPTMNKRDVIALAEKLVAAELASQSMLVNS